MKRIDSDSTEFCGSGYPDRATGEQMDRQQHDPDQKQNPRNLNCHCGHPRHIQGSSNDSNYQEHQRVVQHIMLLSTVRRFSTITGSSMHPQFTHLIFWRSISRALSTKPLQRSLTRNPPHRAQAISPPIPLYSRAVDVFHIQVTNRTPSIANTAILGLWLNGN